MRLGLSVASDSRQFSRMMRRIRPSVQPLIDAFAAVELRDPIHDQLLVGVTNSLLSERCDVVPNDDSCFQLLVGWPADSDLSPDGDDANAATLVSILRRAAAECPFSEPDAAAIRSLFDNWTQA
ncbi:MAG: hypothetical protein AAF497_26985 [Planctomycetota bacterium]